MDSNRNISRSVIVKTLGPLSCAVKSGVLVSEAPHWPTLLAQFEHLFSPCLSYPPPFARSSSVGRSLGLFLRFCGEQ